jgi:hypothetical protein
MNRSEARAAGNEAAFRAANEKIDSIWSSASGPRRPHASRGSRIPATDVATVPSSLTVA